MKRWTFYVTLSSYDVLWPTSRREYPIEAETYDAAMDKAKRVREVVRAELAGTKDYISACVLSGACVEVAA